MKDSLTSVDYAKAREHVVNAQDAMQEAIDLLREYVKLTGDVKLNADLLDGLVIMTSEDHGFATQDKNLDNVLADLDAVKIVDVWSDDIDPEHNHPTEDSYYV